jgi:hypothetical protein
MFGPDSEVRTSLQAAAHRTDGDLSSTAAAFYGDLASAARWPAAAPAVTGAAALPQLFLM